MLADVLPLDGVGHLVDLGGGTGVYGMALAQKNPGLRVSNFDRPEVLKVASGILAERGPADRVAMVEGDLFGEYRLARLPVVGDRFIFSNVGAYSLIKASRFNGHDLPAVYLRKKTGRLELLKKFGYQDYHDQWGMMDAMKTQTQTPI